MVISTLAGGAAYSSKVDTDIEEAMVLIEDNKLSYHLSKFNKLSILFLLGLNLSKAVCNSSRNSVSWLSHI